VGRRLVGVITGLAVLLGGIIAPTAVASDRVALAPASSQGELDKAALGASDFTMTVSPGVTVNLGLHQGTRIDPAEMRFEAPPGVHVQRFSTNCPYSDGFWYAIQGDKAVLWTPGNCGYGGKGATFTITLGIDANLALGTHTGTYRALKKNGDVLVEGMVVFDVGAPPEVTTHPDDAVAAVGGTASFTVAAAGTPPLSVRWQYSKDDGLSWSNSTEESATSWTFTTPTLAITHDGYRYRAVTSNAYGEVVSDSARLTVGVAPVVTRHPDDAVVAVGDGASFTVAAEGAAPLSVRWQYSTDDGKSWSNSNESSARSWTLLLAGRTLSHSGYRYRAVISNAYGEVVSDSARLTVGVAPVVTRHPDDAVVAVGDGASFTVAATPAPLSVSWELSTDGGTTWSQIAGATENVLTLESTDRTMNGNLYRAVFTNAVGSRYTNAAQLTVNEAVTITAPADDLSDLPAGWYRFRGTGPVGATVRLTVQAEGATTGATTSTAVDSAGEWSYSRLLTAGEDIWRLTVQVSDQSATAVSRTYRVFGVPDVTAHPADVSVGLGGGPVSFRASATNASSTQWEVSTDDGATWAEVVNGTEPTLTIDSPDLTMSGNLYRAVFTNAAGTSRSNAARLTVAELLTMTSPVGDQLAGVIRYEGAAPADAQLVLEVQVSPGSTSGAFYYLEADADGHWEYSRSMAASDTEWWAKIHMADGSLQSVRTTYRVRDVEPIDILSPGSGSVHASGTVTLTGTAHPSSVLRPVVGDDVQPLVEVAADGTWSTTVDLVQGRYTVTVGYESLEGTAASVELAVWDEAVSITTAGGLQAVEGGVVTPGEDGGFEVTGTGFPGRTVVVDGRAYGGGIGDSVSAVVDQDGRWQVRLAGDLADYRWRDVVLIAREEGAASDTRVAVVVLWPILISAPLDGSIVLAGTDVTLQARGFSWLDHEVLVDGEVVQTVPSHGDVALFTTTIGAELLRPGSTTITVRQPGLPDHTASVTIGVANVAAVDLRVDARVRRVDRITELKEIAS
jgi:hypothetical protein